MRRELSFVLAAGLLLAGGALCRVEAGDAAGMRAAVDPKTGALLPRDQAAAQAQATPAPAQPRTTEDVVQVPLEGGGARVDLPERFRRPLVAHVAPDGSVQIQHENSPTR